MMSLKCEARLLVVSTPTVDRLPPLLCQLMMANFKSFFRLEYKKEGEEYELKRRLLLHLLLQLPALLDSTWK